MGNEQGTLPFKMGNEHGEIIKGDSIYRNICINKYNPLNLCEAVTCNHEKVKVRNSGIKYGEDKEPNIVVNCNDHDCVCYRLYPEYDPISVDLDVNEIGIIKLSINHKTKNTFPKEKTIRIVSATDPLSGDMGAISLHDMINDFQIQLVSPNFTHVKLPLNIFLLPNRLHSDTLTSWFLYWVHNHPIYCQKYDQSQHVELLEPEIYDDKYQDSFEKVFDMFLSFDTDEIKNKQLSLFFLSEDGTIFQIHRLTPDQKEKYSLKKFTFLFVANCVVFCPISKLLESYRLKIKNIPKWLADTRYLVNTIIYYQNDEPSNLIQ